MPSTTANSGFVSPQRPTRSGRISEAAPTTSMTPSLFSQPTSQMPALTPTPRLDAFNSYQNTILPPMAGIGPVAPQSRRLA